jgi:hypothetical protein
MSTIFITLLPYINIPVRHKNASGKLSAPTLKYNIIYAKLWYNADTGNKPVIKMFNACRKRNNTPLGHEKPFCRRFDIPLRLPLPHIGK